MRENTGEDERGIVGMADGKRTMKELYREHVEINNKRRVAELERGDARLQRTLGKLYKPSMLKHPTEDREVTFRQWKHAQQMVIKREKMLLREMKTQYDLHYRSLVWLSNKLQGSIIRWTARKTVQGYHYAVPRIKQLGNRYRKRSQRDDA